MQANSYFFLVLLLLLLTAVLLAYLRGKKLRRLEEVFAELKHQKKSGEVLHGKSWEEFAPFMKHYPFDPKNFKFLGMPIDGISFEDDAIYFVEIKTGKSGLNMKQKQIRAQVEEGQVKWLEFRG